MAKNKRKTMNPDATVRRGYLIEDYRVFHISSLEKEMIPPHFHGFHKLILVIKGNLQYIIEGMSCKVMPGEVLFVPAGSIHQPVIGRERYERIVLWISTEAPELNGLEAAFRLAAEERRYLISDRKTADGLCRIAEADKEKGFGAVQLENALLTEALVNFGRCVLEESAGLPGHGEFPAEGTDLQDELVVRIADHIAEHLTEDLGSDALAEQFFVSESSLIARFRRATGCSIHRYVLQKRLISAARRIRLGVPAVQAAEESGFSDYSTFYRAFKKYFDMSPRHFRS